MSRTLTPPAPSKPHPDVKPSPAHLHPLQPRQVQQLRERGSAGLGPLQLSRPSCFRDFWLLPDWLGCEWLEGEGRQAGKGAE